MQRQGSHIYDYRFLMSVLDVEDDESESGVTP